MLLLCGLLWQRTGCICTGDNMSDYDKYNNEITARKRRNLELRREAQRLEQTIATVETSKKEFLNKLDAMVERAKAEGREAFISSAVAPLERDLSSVKAKLVELNNNYKEEINNCSEEVIYEELKKRDSISSNIKDAISDVKQIIVSDIGERFANEFISQIKVDHLTVDSNNLSYTFKKFLKIKSRVEEISSKRKFSFLDSMSDNIDYLVRTKLAGNPKGPIIFAGISILAIVLASWVIFPIYVMILLGVIAINVRRGSVYSNAMIEYKIAENNLSRIDAILRERAKEECQRILLEIKTEFESAINELNEKQNHLSNEIRMARDKAFKEYTFDEQAYRNQYSSTILDFDRKISSLKSDLESIREQQTRLQEEITELDIKVKSVVDSIKLTYLDFNKVGESRIFDNTSILLDVKDNTPILFDFPKQPCIFLYDDASVVYDFIRLLALQLRIRLNPFSLKIEVWDKKELGVRFTQFYSKDKTLFLTAINNESIEDRLDTLSDLTIKRVEIIRREFENIDEYNKYMQEIDSATEYYHFLFMIDPPDQVIKKDKLIQLFSVGSSVGIYPIMFLSLHELDKDHIPYFKVEGRFFRFEGDEIKKKAGNWVLEELLKFGR